MSTENTLKHYQVLVTREVTESALVPVVAAGAEEAAAIAVGDEFLSEHEHRFTPDDPSMNGQGAYLGDPVEAVQPIEPEEWEYLKESGGQVFVVVQGGDYDQTLHSHETAEAAEEDRIACTIDHARTSDVVSIPASLACHPEFYDVVETILRASRDMGYVEVPAQEAAEEEA